MGIYIKGMKMPKDGCHHIICIYADGTVSTGGRKYTAVPVPPHGRCVDADVLFRTFETVGWWDNDDRDKAEDILLDALTIIPSEPPKEE